MMGRVLARTLWGAAVIFGAGSVLSALTFLAISGRPVLSASLALLTSAALTLLGSAVHFCELTCFEYRLLWFRSLDSRLPLQEGEQILLSELAAYASRFYIRGGGLYLTTTRFLFVPTRRRWPTVVLPIDRNLSIGLASRDLRAPFQGGIRTRLRVQRRGEGEHLFIVWKPEWWVKTLRARVLQTPSR